MIATKIRKSKAPWTIDRWEEFADRCRSLRDGLAAYALDLKGIAGNTGPAILAITGARGAHQRALVRAAEVFKAQHPDRADDLPSGLALDVPGVDDRIPYSDLPKSTPTREQWMEIGRRLKQFARDAGSLMEDFQSTALANKVRTGAFLVTCDRIGSAKVKLDSLVCAQHPNWLGATKAFYGPPTPEPDPVDAHDGPHDAPSVAHNDNPADAHADAHVSTTGPPRAKAGPVRLDPGVAYELACRHRMPFGKYEGQTLSDIAETDVDYLGWLVGRKLLPPLRRSITMVLNGRVARPSGPDPETLDVPSKTPSGPIGDGTDNLVVCVWAGMGG